MRVGTVAALALALSAIGGISVTTVTTVQAAPSACRAPQGAQPGQYKLEAYLVCLINDRRAHPAASEHRAALPALTLSLKQSACSRQHSTGMASIDKLSHDASPAFPSDICVPHASTLDKGENLGEWPFLSVSKALKRLNTEMWAEGPCPSPCPADGAKWEAHSQYLMLTYPHFSRIGIGVYVQDPKTDHSETWLTEDLIQR